MEDAAPFGVLALLCLGVIVYAFIYAQDGPAEAGGAILIAGLGLVGFVGFGIAALVAL